MARLLPRLTVTRAVMLLAALVIGYFIFAAAGDALLSHQLNSDERRLQDEIDDLHRQEAELVAIREYLQTEEYIEGVARRLLSLVRPGERLVVVSSDAPPAAPTPEDATTPPDQRPWWERLYEP